LTTRPARYGASTPATLRRSPAFADIDLLALRSYRRALVDEEHRISYWRRILQARLDLLGAGSTAAGGNAVSLRRLLSNDHIDQGRRALLDVLPRDDIPPLPELDQLWAQDPAPGDDEHTSRLLADLSKAERQLSAYRGALHRRLSAATGELMARYQESPRDCLSALPEVPEQAGPPSES